MVVLLFPNHCPLQLAPFFLTLGHKHSQEQRLVEAHRIADRKRGQYHLLERALADAVPVVRQAASEPLDELRHEAQ